MPSHDRESSSCNGVSRSNLFLESDPEDDLRPAAAAPAAAAASVWGFSAARQRGRGLVVPVVDAHPPRGATRGASDVARFMRRGTSVGALLRTARRQVRRAGGNAQRLLGRLAARPPERPERAVRGRGVAAHRQLAGVLAARGRGRT